MTEKVTTGGVGFLGLLTLLFIGLKLGKVIDWSWWWILSPILIPIGLVLSIFLVVIIIWTIKKVIK